MTVHGSSDAAFTGVADAFAESFATLGELGAATAVAVGGRPVVDLWGGDVDDRGRPWAADTIVNVFSVGKPFAAACALLLVERGRIDLDGPVARWWPEFAAAGKGEVTVRHVLAHQAGLDLFEQPLSPEVLFDWDRAAELLAESPPRWPPGSTHGEHALFYGHLLGELVRRVDGRSLGVFFRDEVARPWGLELAFGLSEDEIQRTADVADPDGSFLREQRVASRSYRLAMDNPPAMLQPEVVNGDAWRRAEIPAVNAHGTARAVARFYAGLAAGGILDGVRLLSPALASEAVAEPQRTGLDEVLGCDVGWGLGVQIDEDGFGMGGLGGNLGWWCRDGYSIAYVTRRLGAFDRSFAVEAALRDALGLPPLADDAAASPVSE